MPTAKSNVVVVRDDTFFTLISHEPNVPPKLFRYLASISTLAQQGIHSSDLGPALFQSHFGKVRGRFPAVPVVELDLNSMSSHLWVRTGWCISECLISIASTFPAQLLMLAHQQLSANENKHLLTRSSFWLGHLSKPALIYINARGFYILKPFSIMTLSLHTFCAPCTIFLCPSIKHLPPCLQHTYRRLPAPVSSILLLILSSFFPRMRFLPYLPVKVIQSLFKVGEQGDSTFQLWDLLYLNRLEATVLHWTVGSWRRERWVKGTCVNAMEGLTLLQRTQRVPYAASLRKRSPCTRVACARGRSST